MGAWKDQQDMASSDTPDTVISLFLYGWGWYGFPLNTEPETEIAAC